MASIASTFHLVYNLYFSSFTESNWIVIKDSECTVENYVKE